MDSFEIHKNYNLKMITGNFFGSVTYKTLLQFLEQLQRCDLVPHAKVYLDFTRIEKLITSYTQFLNFKKNLYLICYKVPKIKIALVGPSFDTWENVFNCCNPSDAMENKDAAYRFLTLNYRENAHS